MSRTGVSSFTEYLRMSGTDGSIFAIGDCTATSYAPTAQVASQQGAYLARVLAQIAKKDALEAKLKNLQTKVGGVESEVEAKGLVDEVENVKKQIDMVKLRPFNYSHQGSLA